MRLLCCLLTNIRKYVQIIIIIIKVYKFRSGINMTFDHFHYIPHNTHVRTVKINSKTKHTTLFECILTNCEILTINTIGVDIGKYQLKCLRLGIRQLQFEQRSFSERYLGRSKQLFVVFAARSPCSSKIYLCL